MQQVFDKRNAQGQLIWIWSATVNGIEITSKLNYNGKQFNDMRLHAGNDGHHLGCFARIENFHHEIIDKGKFI
jgi:hypothetical protein